MILGFDFETRGLVDLREVGLYVYARDPGTEPTCYAWAFGDQDPLVHDMLRSGTKELNPAVAEHVRAGGLIRAWNADFELQIWNVICVWRYGWPVLKPEQMIDTMALAATRNLPQGLGDCARLLGLPQDQQKDKRGKYLIQTLSKPRSVGQHKGEFREDSELLDENLEYCKQDVVAERAIAARLGPLPEEGQRRWVLTQKINQRGVPINRAAIERITRTVELETARLNDELARMTGIDGATKRDQVLGYLRGLGLDLADLTGETVERALEDETLDEVARRVLEIRRDACQTSTAKFPKMLSIANADDRIRGLLTYHGASTGRFASRGGLNIQNLPRPTIKPFSKSKKVDPVADAVSALTTLDHDKVSLLFGEQVMDAAVSSVRGVIQAPPGYDLIDADFSSVENRVASWIAGQTDKVEAFAQGMDEYKLFATQLYNISYEEVTKDQRQVAKSAVLGCMFGQGWRGLIEYAKTYGVDLDEANSQRIVDLYRGQYKKVQTMWYDCGKAMVNVCRHPNVVMPVGKVAFLFDRKEDFLKMRLPSGRVIYWYQPRLETVTTPWGSEEQGVIVWTLNQRTKKWERRQLIGSSAYQSSVQGTAADLLVHGVTCIEALGKYEVVTLIHDEVLALVRKGVGSEEEFGETLCTRPEYAQDLPLAYEAWRGNQFRK